jgi:hypothetical protein
MLKADLRKLAQTTVYSLYVSNVSTQYSVAPILTRTTPSIESLDVVSIVLKTSGCRVSCASSHRSLIANSTWICLRSSGTLLMAQFSARSRAAVLTYALVLLVLMLWYSNQVVWRAAVDELLKIDAVQSTHEKLLCILECCKATYRALAEQEQHRKQHQQPTPQSSTPPRTTNATRGGVGVEVGADQFLPLLILIVIHSGIRTLHSNIQYGIARCLANIQRHDALTLPMVQHHTAPDISIAMQTTIPR